MDFLKKQITDLYDRGNRQRSVPKLRRNAEPLQSSSPASLQLRRNAEPLQSSSSASLQLHSPKPLRQSSPTSLHSRSLIQSVIITPAVHQTCSLANIPVEIFLLILKYIPPSSAILLSLTCKIFQPLGNDYSEALSENAPENSLLLSLIAKDLPQQIACHSCYRLHNMKDAVRYYQAKKNVSAKFQRRPRALQCRLDTCLMLDYEQLIDEEFSPSLFHMAMKRSLHDPDCVQFLDILSRESTDEFGLDGWIKESQTDCRIVRGSFIHRAQKAWISDNNRPTLFGLSMEPCAHMEVFYINGCIYTRAYALATCHDDEASQRIPFNRRKPEITLDLMKCNRCATQCQLTMKTLAGRGIAIFITRWADLGSSILDEKWKRYFYREIFDFGYQVQPDSLILSSAFENDGGFRSKVESRFYRRFPQVLQSLVEE
ncbi:hypothetical protein OCU04_011449 [Sclerotinia nivalis]|uniref:F-box domain-containing protein n=1 Tax=Sclerotinia nivalis TaxID=352851 RepID=A0A9X0AF96_9HELO|nr:hypothetical protein OCU04_011449 [Sclerotinia nivalis]